MAIFDEEDNDRTTDIYADFFMESCDVPASRKCAGHAGHGHNLHPCPWCKITIVDVDTHIAYTREGDFCHLNKHTSSFSDLLR